MAHRKCAICGNGIEEGSFCSEHSPQGITYTPFEVNVCKCGKIHLHGTWKPAPNLTATVKKLVKEHVKENPIRVDTPDIRTPNGGQTIEIEATITRGTNESTVKIKINGVACPTCKQQGGYFEATIQARNLTPERTAALEKAILSAAPRIRITKKEPQPKGADYYVSNQRIASSIVERIHRRFGGNLTSTAKLFSRDHLTMKDLYRSTHHLVFPDFDVGDVVAQEDNIVLIQSLGKQCKGLDLKTEKRMIVNFNETHEKLTIHTTEVVQTSPKVLVLHPRTFQAEPIENETETKVGDKIKVVEHNGLYAINQ